MAMSTKEISEVQNSCDTLFDVSNALNVNKTSAKRAWRIHESLETWLYPIRGLEPLIFEKFPGPKKGTSSPSSNVAALSF